MTIEQPINNISTNMMTLFCGLMFSLPGLKFFYFSGILNILVSVSIVLTLLLSCAIGRMKFPPIAYYVVVFWFFFFFSFFIFGFEVYEEIGLMEFSRYVSLPFLLFSLLFGYNLINIDFLLSYIICWSLLLAALYWLGFIVPTGAGSLSYLILSMQIGMGYTVLLSRIACSRKDSAFGWFFLFFLFFSILSLPGRASLFLCIFITLFLISIYVVTFYKKKFIRIVVCTLMFSFAGVYFYEALKPYIFNEFLYAKIVALIGGDDPRFNIYIEAFHLIMDSPFGLGLGGYLRYFEAYPHNIFLEIALNSGVFTAGLFLVFCMLWFFVNLYDLFVKRSRDVKSLSLFILSFYLLSLWNFSNDFGSSYSLLFVMSLSIVYTLNKYSRKGFE